MISTLKGWRPRPLDDRGVRSGGYHPLGSRGEFAEDVGGGKRECGGDRKAASEESGEEGSPILGSSDCSDHAEGEHEGGEGAGEPDDERPDRELPDLVRVSDAGNPEEVEE